MNDEQLLRYSRHILLPQVDVAGQEAISRSRVMIIGAGGLGSPVALYLAAAGVSELIIVDDDFVDSSNLQRQIVHKEKSIGMNKAASAKASIEALNGNVAVTAVEHRLDEQGLHDYLSQGVDLVIDCCDNLASRFLLNKICCELRLPFVLGAAIRFEGQVSVFDLRKDDVACYACVFGGASDEQMSCSESGVFSPIVGVVGSMQALEGLKLLAGIESGLSGRLALFDGMKNIWRYINLAKDSQCKVCSGH